jgi:hypothetical protein
MNHAIDHAALRKAAEHLTAIIDAGYREQVSREYHERVAELPLDQRYDRCRDPLREMQLTWDAKLLALLTSAPMDQCLAATREARGEMARRDIGLTLLRELAGEVCRVQAQTTRSWRARS